MTSFAGKRVVVLGLARSGEAATRALLDLGARVRVLDAADTPAHRERAARVAAAEVILGRTDAEDIEGDLIVASPGIAWTSPWIKAAEAGSIRVWSEIELAYALGARPVIGITGTNGKTTATEMATACLREAGRDPIAAGNIGTPLVDVVNHACVVAELSSFQLQGIEAFRVPVAVLLNIANDHLDLHGTFDAYARAKGRIFENQTPDDAAIVHDDATCRGVASTRGHLVAFDEDTLPDGGAGIDDGWIVVPQGRVMPVADLPAQHRPMRADAIAAAAAACAAGAPPDACARALRAYRPAPHRVEVIAEIDAVTYINDSKATDPHATLAALEGLQDVVLIAGGRNKGLDLGELTGAAARLRAVVSIGEAAAEIEEAFSATGVHVERARDMEEAVERARGLARAGGVVLLSPACASFDMFDGYAARGDAFRAAVERIRGGSR